MAYIINKTSGAPLVLGNSTDGILADGKADSTTSITLIGKNTANYGEVFNENFVRLLESHANITPPANPIEGQLWYDTVNKQLNVSDGVAGFVPVRPINLATGVLDEEILDTSSVPHDIVKIVTGNKVVAIISPDAEFTPSVSVSGFTTIKTGITLAADDALGAGLDPRFQGTATAAESLIDPLSGATFETDRIVRADAITGIVNLQNISGTSAGELTGLNAPANDTDAATKLYVDTQVSNVVGNSTALLADGSVALVADLNLSGNQVINVGNPVNSTDATNKSYVDAATVGQTAAQLLASIKTVDGSGSGLDADLLDGQTRNSAAVALTVASRDVSGDLFANIFQGTATTAQYADLAERFESNEVLAPGTVVELGGTAEIQAVQSDLTDNVFGVISTNVAYLMNSEAGSNETHPPVALSGRVPVRVVGEINKGDRLVSAGNGLARAASINEITAFNVIGRSLENKSTVTEGTVEAIVRIN